MPKKPSGAPLTPAERYERAVEREAEVTAQLEAVDARIAEARQSLEALAQLAQTAQHYVANCERAEDHAAAAEVDARSRLLVDEGSDLEAEAQAELAAAQAAHDQTLAALTDARARQGEVERKVEADAAAIRAQHAGDERTRRELTALCGSLERQVRALHAAAGRAALAAAAEQHAALTARLDELVAMRAAAEADLDGHYQVVAALGQQFPEVVATREYALISEPDDRGVVAIVTAWVDMVNTLCSWAGRGGKAITMWRYGRDVPALLTVRGWDETALRSLLRLGGADQQHVAGFKAISRVAEDYLAAAERDRLAKLAALPPALTVA